MVAMNPDGVIYMGSFSKVLTPGIRLGYVVAPLPLVRRLVLAKQAADLHTSQLTQMVVHQVIKDGFLDRHIPKIRTLYGDQCQCMLDAMDAALPGRRRVDQAGRRHVHLGHAAQAHRRHEAAR